LDDALWTAIVAFTREELGRPWFDKVQPLTLSTRVLDDLRIDGDDAIEFIDRLFAKFNVKGDFPYARYFDGEGTAGLSLLLIPFLVGTLFRFVFRLKHAPDPDEHPLTLGMLYEACRVGRWSTEAIEVSERSPGRDA
jgi:hypothetical protein